MTDHPRGHVLTAFPTEPLPGLWAWVSPATGVFAAGVWTVGNAAEPVFECQLTGATYDRRNWADGYDQLIRLDGCTVEPRRLADMPREALERHPWWMLLFPDASYWEPVSSLVLLGWRKGSGGGCLLYPIRHTESGVERVPWSEVLPR